VVSLVFTVTFDASLLNKSIDFLKQFRLIFFVVVGKFEEKKNVKITISSNVSSDSDFKWLICLCPLMIRLTYNKHVCHEQSVLYITWASLL